MLLWPFLAGEVKYIEISIRMFYTGGEGKLRKEGKIKNEVGLGITIRQIRKISVPKSDWCALRFTPYVYFCKIIFRVETNSPDSRR
jgi:hypothetical protein